MSAFKNANLGLAFLLELIALAALGYWGFNASSNPVISFGLGIGLPLIAIVIWAIFGAPRSNRRLQNPWLEMLRAVFFGSGVLALLAAGQTALGLAVAVLVIINLVLVHVWAQ